MTATANAAGPEQGRRGFSLPSAYTILFLLIVIVALLTWIIPAGAYDVDADGEPIPGTYHTVAANPQRIVVDSLMAPINGLYGIESRGRQHQRLELGRAVRGDRRRPVHPRHRRVPRASRWRPGRSRAGSRGSSHGCAGARAG